MLYTAPDRLKEHVEKALANFDAVFNASKSLLELGPDRTIGDVRVEQKQLLSDIEKTKYLAELSKRTSGKFTSLESILKEVRGVQAKILGRRGASFIGGQ